jgi:hypothetical protein
VQEEEVVDLIHLTLMQIQEVLEEVELLKLLHQDLVIHHQLAHHKVIQVE